MAHSENERSTPIDEFADIGDLLRPSFPRRAIVAQRRWMEPYHATELQELSERLHSSREHASGFFLWQQAFTLYRSAFSGTFDFSHIIDRVVREAHQQRSRFLGLVGTAAKPTLDLLLAGYYWMVFGQLRNLHETWRRVAFLKLSPKVAVPYFKLPSMSPVRQDGSIRSTHIRLDPALIEKAVRKSGSDRDKKFWDLSSAGFSHFHGGAHPSSEGLLQLVSESDDKLIFGPNYNADLCAFCLEWGIAGLIMLLHEIDELVPQSPEWRGSLEVLSNQYSDWLERYNREFVFGRRVRFVFDLPFRSSDASTDFDAATLHVLSPEQVGERIRGHYAFMLRLGGTSEIALKITARYGALYDLSVEDVSSCLLADQFKSHKDTGET